MRILSADGCFIDFKTGPRGRAPTYFFFTTGGSSTVSKVMSESAEYFR
jgi:hypothetical protein